MRWAVSLAVLLMAVWLLLSGHYTVLITSLGVVSVLCVVWLCWLMDIVDEEAVPVRLLPRAILYIPWITWQVFVANVDVARRVLGGRVSPRVFDAPTSQKTDLGRVLYANSITLTPGTVSVVVNGTTIVVHTIHDEVRNGLLEGDMDRKVTWLEGLS